MSNRAAASRWIWVLGAVVSALAFLAVLLLFFVAPREPMEGAADPRPLGSANDIERLAERTDTNVLFILIDTLRAERLSAYGYERETSPVLARVAGSGIRFARHMSQSSWTKASMASMWSGLYPSRTGVTRFNHMISEEARLPAEILKEAGFQTIGLFRNGWVSPNFGFGQGFDVYTRPTAGMIPPGLRKDNPTIKIGGTDDDVIKTAIEYLRINGRRRWFLYLHLMDIHEYTYDEESSLFGSSYSDIYDNSIRHTDWVLENLMKHLDEMGYAQNTILVIVSDHGEAFRERGVEGHARRVFRETTEVPLIISLPFRLDPGVVVQTRTRNIDVWPTLLELVGLSMDGDIDGQSLVPDVLDAARGLAPSSAPRSAIAHLDHNWGQEAKDPVHTVAVAEGSKRYVISEEMGEMREQLFDAETDPRELVDHADEQPEEVERLRAIGEAYLEKKPPWGEAPMREIDEMELNQLRALGYAVP